MHRRWMLLLLLLLSACGGQPEQVVLPTVAEVPTDPTAVEATEPPPPEVVASPFPTARPDRLAAPDRTGTLQFAAVGGGPDGAVGAVELFAVDVASNTLARLTVDEGAEMHPAWTPDGDRIIVEASPEGTPYLYVVNALNTNPVQRLSAFPSGDQRHPTLSPDGLLVAFVSSRGGVDDIYRMSAIDGRAVLQLTANPTPDYDPAFSPDNNWIAFVSERDGNPEIYVMDVNGDNLLRLTDHPAPDYQPAFSPDGRSLVFVSERRSPPQLFVIDLPIVREDIIDQSAAIAIDIDGGVPPVPIDTTASVPRVRPITADPFAKSSPSWYRASSGGFRIVYAAEVNGPDGPISQVYEVSGDGSNIRPLTELTYDLGAPVVRPGSVTVIPFTEE